MGLKQSLAQKGLGWQKESQRLHARVCVSRSEPYCSWTGWRQASPQEGTLSFFVFSTSMETFFIFLWLHSKSNENLCFFSLPN